MNKLLLSDRIVIFGTGSSEYSFTRSYPDIDPLFYLDNNVEKQYSLHRGKLILPPDVLKKISNEKIQIIIASEFYDEISEQLRGYGLRENIEFFPHVKLLFEVTDYFLISFMKCGRTWLRFMLGHLLEDLFRFGEEDRLIYTDTCRKYGNRIPVITALHDDNPHLKVKENLEQDKRRYRDKRVLFMVRDPRDVAISLFYHMKFRAKKYEGSLEDFVLRHVETIVEYYNIWFENSEQLKEFHIVRYEDLHSKPLITFKEVVKFLGIDADSTAINKAIDKSKFKNMRKYEALNQLNNTQLKPADEEDERSFKVRKGKTGGYKEELSKGITNQLNKYIRELNPIFGYLV